MKHVLFTLFMLGTAQGFSQQTVSKQQSVQATGQSTESAQPADTTHALHSARRKMNIDRKVAPPAQRAVATPAPATSTRKENP